LVIVIVIGAEGVAAEVYKIVARGAAIEAEFYLIVIVFRLHLHLIVTRFVPLQRKKSYRSFLSAKVGMN